MNKANVSKWMGLLLLLILLYMNHSPFISQAAPTAVDITLPFFEDFETAVTGDPGTLPPYWVNVAGENAGTICIGLIEQCHDWTVDEGGTPTTDTGPSIDHTTGTATGKYVYVEASDNAHAGATPNDFTRLQSPIFDLVGTDQPELSFWDHRFSGGGDGGHELRIDIINADGSVTIADDIYVINRSGKYQDIWVENSIDLTPYINSGEIRILFERVWMLNEMRQDIAIDDVLIHDAATLGGRIWNDADGDGVQDIGESPIDSVTVNLYQETSPESYTLVGTTTTDIGTGEYIFNSSNVTGGVLPDTTYVIRIDDVTPISNLGLSHLSPANQDAYAIDTDGTMGDVAGEGSRKPEIVITTSDAKHNNHSLGFGFNVVPTAVSLLSLQESVATSSFDVAMIIVITMLATLTATAIFIRRKQAVLHR